MFVKPLQLTQRETEIARMVVNGHTRPEIAAALGISTETVKKHTTNIVLKCDASSQREAASILYMHEFIYGASGLDADFFIMKRDARIIIDDDRVTSTMIADSIQVCCKDQVTEKEGDVYCDGEIEYVEVDGRRVVAIRSERGRLWYKTLFNPPIQRGQIIHRTLRAGLKSSFRFPTDYFFIEQPLPCSELRIGVEFGPSFHLSTVEFDARLGTKSYAPVETKVVGERAIEWIIQSPKVLSQFTIRWSVGSEPASQLA